MQGQSLRCIAVGRCTKSNGLTFYHPPTKQLLSSTDFVLDPTLASGPTFKLPYEGGIFFNTYSDMSEDLRPPAFPPESTAYMKTSDDTFREALVLAIPT